MAICERPGMRSLELAAALKMDRNNLQTVVRHLSAVGLIKISRARKKINQKEFLTYEPTAKGQGLAERSMA